MTIRVKTYGQLEAEVFSLEKQVEFYRSELEGAVQAERHRACIIVRQFLDEGIADELCNNILEDDT
jgi:hypothetical protein